MTTPGGPEAAAKLRRDALRGALGVAAVSLACNIGALSVPLYNMALFNRVMTTHNLRTLAGLTAGLAVGLSFYIAIDHFRVAAMRVLGERFARDLAPALMRASARHSVRTADPMQAMRDIETLRQFVGGPLLTIPFDLFWAPVLLTVLFAMGWAYAAVAVVSIAALAGLNLLGDRIARRPMLAANEATVASFRDVALAAKGAEAVVAMGMLPALARRWEGARHQALAAGARAQLRGRLMTSIARTSRAGMTGAMVATGLVLVLNGYASAGSLVAGNMILARLLMPFEQFANTLRQWVDAAAAWRRVETALREAGLERYADGLPSPEGRLIVERLLFMPRGADRPVLRGVSFELEPGQSLAVVGPSASGKSTLLKMILGMAKPDGGGVFLDGHSTYLWNRADFARHVGYLPQSVSLSDGTVAEIIAHGGVPDMKMAVAAARLAGVHKTIAKLPFGYATQISGGGFALSAGQRQRVALARALYGTPRLLILDEPNAFLDEAGEAMLSALMARLRAEKIGVLISTHRPSVASAADTVLVLRDGAIARFGPGGEVLRALSGPALSLVRAPAAVAAS